MCTLLKLSKSEASAATGLPPQLSAHKADPGHCDLPAGPPHHPTHQGGGYEFGHLEYFRIPDFNCQAAPRLDMMPDASS